MSEHQSEPKPKSPNASGNASEDAIAGAVKEAVEEACAHVAPLWPLDRFIAVNPFWGLTGQSPSQVAVRLASLSGARLTQSRSEYLRAIQKGKITRHDLQAALDESESSMGVDQLLAALESNAEAPARRPLMVDVADSVRDLSREMPWRDFVVRSLGQHCASFFDDGQAQLRAPTDAPGRRGWLVRKLAQHGALGPQPPAVDGKPNLSGGCSGAAR